MIAIQSELQNSVSCFFRYPMKRRITARVIFLEIRCIIDSYLMNFNILDFFQSSLSALTIRKVPSLGPAFL